MTNFNKALRAGTGIVRRIWMKKKQSFFTAEPWFLASPIHHQSDYIYNTISFNHHISAVSYPLTCVMLDTQIRNHWKCACLTRGQNLARCLLIFERCYQYHRAKRWSYGVSSNNRTHYNDVIMGAMRLKSPASRLFAQPFIQVQIKENIKASRHWPLWGELTGEFPAQRTSNAENVSIWWRHYTEML